jgi:YidC/Oxa1 family membrane protein insertase
VNKNSILAFVLILATVALFTSPQYNKFYYEKILKKPYPQVIKKSEKKEKNNETNSNKIESNLNDEPIKNSTKEIVGNLDTNFTANDTIWVENEKLVIGIEKRGAVITTITLKEYKDSKTKELIEIMDKIGRSGADLEIDGKSYDNEYFELKNTKEKHFKNTQKEGIQLSFEAIVNGESIVKEFQINDDYKIGINIKKQGLSGKRVKIGWNSGIVESEYKNGKTNNNQIEIKKAHYYNGESVQSIQMDKEESDEPTGLFKWVGISSKYFFISIGSDTLSDADISVKGVIEEENGKKDKRFINYKISYEKTAEKEQVNYWVYAGPSKYDELKKHEEKFEKTLFPVIGFGRIFFWSDKWFPWVAEFVLWVLLSLHKIVKDYGIAIVLITILSKIVTFPLTHSSTKSMNRMKDAQPKIENLRKRYKNNPKKLNEEIMALYKQEGINPLNPGCLPMFLQMPVFIALFVVLKKAIELREATTVIVPWIKDLSKAEAIFTLGAPLPMYGDNIALLPVIMAVLTYFQTKMTTKDPNQKAMIYVMPVFMLALFNSFPSGLVIYWTFQSALGLVQQIITDKLKKK